MNFRVLCIVLLLFYEHAFTANDPVEMRRVCSVGNDVDIFWFKTSDTCSKYQQYFIWARTGTSGPFFIIDSIPNISQENYTHLGANANGAKDWNYFIEYRDSCGPPFSMFSDTLFIDQTPPDTVLIDSVSVDILTNKVRIGWHWNHSPDFKKFWVFRDSAGFYKEITPPVIGTRDTFYTDNRPSSDPSKESLFYDMTSVDSCERPQVFGFNEHHTIFLKSILDSCKKENTLSWTHYMGWNSIRKYYIYKRISFDPAFVLIDSVPGNVNTYTNPIALGQTINYFVRAIKDDPNKLITSSSNLSQISTRLRVDPVNTYLASVSVKQPENNSIEVRFVKDPSEESKSFDLYKSFRGDNSFSKINTASSSDVNNSFIFENTLPVSDPFDFKISSNDLCGIPFSETIVSGNIVLYTADSTVKNSIWWNTYYSWDSGVELYNLYRGTNISGTTNLYTLIATLSENDSVYMDEELPPKIGSNGVCYFVQAIQRAGSSSGQKDTANSNASCVVGKLTVYIPNAFHPEGVNKTFKPGGINIDYDNSSVEVFDRWGGKVKEVNGLSIGWDGTDENGKICPIGVYFYKMKIKSSDGQEQIKSGTVTLLN